MRLAVIQEPTRKAIAIITPNVLIGKIESTGSRKSSGMHGEAPTEVGIRRGV